MLLRSGHGVAYFVRTYRVTHNKKYVKQKYQSNLKASNAYLQVLGSGAPDQPASVILNTIDRRYLFNCGETIDRLCVDSGISLKSINHIFLTRTKWNCIGGITNLCFATIASSGYPPTFHGPVNLYKIVQRMSFLSVIGGMFKHRFTPEIFKTDERFEDEKLIIDSVTLRHCQDSTIIYVCKLKACEGRFSLRKSIEKKIHARFLPILFKGQDVTLDDGTIVSAKEVRSADSPDMNIIFIDIPHKEFLKDLAINEKLKKLIGGTKTNGVELIVHFTPDEVFKTKRYQYFIETIDANRNLIVNDRNKHACMEKIYKLQSKLNKIDPKIHPLLGMKLDVEPKVHDPNDATLKDYGKIPTLYTTYLLRGDPKEYAPPVFSDDEQDEEDISHTVFDETKEDYIDIYKPPPLKLVNEQFPRILFLGTGAASACLFRNSSGVLVHLSKNHSILLDCGAAICSQINRFYGDEAPEIYRRLKAVFVSHMHLDHHIGLPELFRLRQIHLPTKREPLRLLCPLEDLKSWLLFYASNVDPIHSDMKFIDNNILLKDKLSAREQAYLNIESMKTCPVEHFRKSYALSMTFPYQNGDRREFFKLAYSGDMSKCSEFVKIGKNSDLLIHEATFQNEFIEFAKKHRHSSLSMAIEQSKEMQAKHTILTHFSSRYQILPYIDEQLDSNIGIAFDYMEVTPSDLPRLSSLYEKYQAAFPGVVRNLQRKTKNHLRQTIRY